MSEIQKCFKKCHRTRSEAKQAKKRINKNNNREADITNIYFCDICNAYHLTSMGKKRSRSITKKNNHNGE